jgi:hypothetical protein
VLLKKKKKKKKTEKAKIPVKCEMPKSWKRDQLMEHSPRREVRTLAQVEQKADSPPFGLGVAWQAAHLVSGPFNLYRHYEVSIVDWL